MSKRNRNNMKILIAGGAGYIGSVLVPSLLEHGYDIDVIDLLWFGNNLPKEVNVHKKNLFNCSYKHFKGYDQFIFLAGISNDPMAQYDPAKNYIYNAALPAYLAFECKLAGVKRFIYASSCSIYGYTENHLYDEDSPISCFYPYGISKLQGEKGVFQLQDKDFSVIALRQGTVCGHSPRMRFDLVVNTMFKTAMTEKKIIINNPAIWRPVFDIRDTVSAYLRAIQADYSISGPYNVASGNYTVGQVADLVKNEVEKLTGLSISLEINNMPDCRNYKVSFERARVQLGYKNQYDIPDIVRNLFTHLNDYGNLDQDRYYNIRVFTKLKANHLKKVSGF